MERIDQFLGICDILWCRCLMTVKGTEGEFSAVHGIT